jgi:hypothetical protein
MRLKAVAVPSPPSAASLAGSGTIGLLFEIRWTRFVGQARTADHNRSILNISTVVSPFPHVSSSLPNCERTSCFTI